VNYAAGLKLEAISESAPGGLIRLDTHSEEIPPPEMPVGRGGRGRGGAPALRLIVTDVAPASTAAKAGLQPGDWIIDVNGTAATAAVLNSEINAKKPGERIKLRVTRAGTEMDVDVEVVPNVKNTYRFSLAEGALPAQKEILSTWLRIAL
jgi:membrane-associated protease RseP (regulator of RpoE activity)